MTVSTVAGACVIRDAVDLVPFLCGHYLKSGFDHLSFVDDGSSDGTFELLTNIAKRTSCVTVRRVDSETFDQLTLMNETANALIRDGHQIIVPFDADEFWNATADDFVLLSASVPEAVFQGRWVNFVQARKCLSASPFALLNMRFLAPLMEIADRESVAAYSQSFVCYSNTKIAFKTGSAIEINRGQHSLVQGPAHVCGPELQIFHLPLRSRQEIIKRGENYEPRRAATRTDPTQSWQSSFHRDVVAAGKVDLVWAANSFDRNGQLNVYGAPLSLVANNRLRRMLIRAGWHFFLNYGLIPF